MTGEMSRSDVTREAYPSHFAIARVVKGTVHPFDVYQGPYILAPAGRLWIVPQETECSCCGSRQLAGWAVYNESTEKTGSTFQEGDTRAMLRSAREACAKA